MPLSFWPDACRKSKNVVPSGIETFQVDRSTLGIAAAWVPSAEDDAGSSVGRDDHAAPSGALYVGARGEHGACRERCAYYCLHLEGGEAVAGAPLSSAAPG